MTVGMGLHRKSWDIKLAYCWSELPENQKIALKHPKGYARYDPVTGEPLYMILARNCYGVPNAGKIWADDRNKFMMEHRDFNQNGWRCHQCVYDPCLFYLQRGVHETPRSKQEPEFRVGVDPDPGVHS